MAIGSPFVPQPMRRNAWWYGMVGQPGFDVAIGQGGI